MINSSAGVHLYCNTCKGWLACVCVCVCGGGGGGGGWAGYPASQTRINLTAIRSVREAAPKSLFWGLFLESPDN